MVVVDEAESVGRGTTPYRGQRSASFFEALRRTAYNEPRLREAPATAGVDDLDCPRARDAVIPWLYESISGLKLVFAITDEEGDWDLTAENAVIKLEDLGSGALRDAFEGLGPIYEKAYGKPVNPRLTEWTYRRIMETGVGTRAFVKAAVEALDLLRHHPDGHVGAILQ